MKEITLLVYPGIGDIIWCHQKWCPYFDVVNYTTVTTQWTEDFHRHRADPFLGLLPKVGSIDHTIVSQNFYDITLRHGYYRMPIIMDRHNRGQKSHPYSCNYVLERGTRLECIDPEYPIEEDLAIASEPFDPGVGDYLLLYVSGSTHNPNVPHVIWTVEQWLNFIFIVHWMHKLSYPIVMVGAHYDAMSMAPIAEGLRRGGLNVLEFVDLPAAHVVHLIKHCEFFFNFQSGLSIIADLLDVPQMMLYFSTLDELRLSWPKKRNIERGIYNSALFSESPELVAEKMRRRSL